MRRTECLASVIDELSAAGLEYQVEVSTCTSDGGIAALLGGSLKRDRERLESRKSGANRCAGDCFERMECCDDPLPLHRFFLKNGGTAKPRK
jgi:hypothetical protein